ncbi:MAG: efflux RND transporter periplasmic adaptor subunit [bacterium]|nr:efflux RND transporter periplasmic adaptor subunit [bacterium]
MKKYLLIALGVVVICLMVWASLRESGGKGKEVILQKTKIREISSRVKATGEITPEKKVEISAKVVGEIINLPVVEGQEVTSGQLLVEIERDLYEAARNQARAALRQAEVSVRRQEVQLKDAQRNMKRVAELREQGLVSQEVLDGAQLAVDTAEVDIEAQVHSVDQYRSALDRTEDDLARTSIRSPMDGILIQLDAEQGETVVPGSTNLPGSVIMTVADMSRLLAEVEVSEVDVVNVELGQIAEIRLDALGDKTQFGHVVEIATSGRRDPTQGTIRFAVKVVIDDPDPALRPAMTAKVDILTATAENALAIPIQAVVSRHLDDEDNEVDSDDANGEEFDVVYTVADNKTVVTKVVTGISDDLWVEITEGLDEGTAVVSGPYRTLKNLEDDEAVHEKEKDEDDAEDEEDSGGVEVRVE